MHKWNSRLGAAVSFAMSAALLVTLQQQPAWAAKPKPYAPPAAAVQPDVAVRAVPVKSLPSDHAKRAADQPKPVWPTADGPAPVRVAGQASSTTRVEILDQATSARAKMAGLLFRVGRTAGSLTKSGSVGVSVDYRKFATAYGGDWAARLQLVRLPDCALTTPERKECAGQPVPTRNDVAAKQATADVAVGASTLMALAATPTGPTGSYGATTLNASGTWSAGGSSGNFSWSFPMRVPPGLNGPMPTVELGYSSQSVDGRMVSSNNQPSDIGEGFELGTSGFIERRYRNCSSDGGTSDDECWVTDNASLSLNGSGGDLIRDNANENLWHLRNDDGSRIERRFGADNGTYNGEWWVVTSANGTQYWFGRNKLPGYSSGDTTMSAWTVPVFGNNTGEKCHKDTFAASSCVQGWRWNLDYVVDPHYNTMSFWYGTDSNNYQSSAVGVKSYIRGGRLDHVSYGTRVEPDLATGTDTIFNGHASARVDFGYDDRCLNNCTVHDGTHWPDTPWDLACTSSTTCTARMPSFFSTRRLATVTTGTYEALTGKFRNVERWTLTHSYPDPEDGTRAGLWLAKISHVGLVGGGDGTSIPDVTFTGKNLPNRVDAVDNAPPMNWRRLTDINSETGAIVHVDYLDTDCSPTSKPSSPAQNTKRCYPVKWTPSGYPQQTDYFNRYVVNEVTETDRTGGATRVLHHYDYIGTPAWHYTDDDGLIDDDAKTWSQWRGYEKVGVTTGDPGGQTYTESTYFRGMNGDYLTATTKRSASVKDSRSVLVADDDAYTGMVRETRTLNGPDGAEVSGEINDPVKSAARATRTIAGATVESRFVNIEGTHSRVTLDHAPWTRTTYTKTTFDDYGMPTRTDDYGDEAVTGDEQCTATTYEPRNTTLWLTSLPQRIQTYAVGCGQTGGTVAEANVIGDALTLYDSHGYGVAPTKGDVTETDQMIAYNNGSPSYKAVTKSAYDDLGRVVDSWDVLDHHSATAYTPARTGPVTQTVDTNPMGWTTTSIIEPAWGLATATVDVNQLRTTLKYDGLGRLTGMWSPGRSLSDPADVAYDYLIRTDGVNAVTTSHINPTGGVTKSYTLYDGLLRTRQTQTSSPKGGRILTDTFYDAAGRAYLSNGAYWDPTGSPGTSVVKPMQQEDVPNQTRTVFDGAGRAISSIFQPRTVERWRTTTVYGGDHTDVEPPTGATASSTWVDARGRTIQLRQYPTRSATGTDYDHTDYAYNAKGLLDSVTTPDGSKWTYTYDLRGRKISSTDPDAGKSMYKYDDAGKLTTSQDGNNAQLFHTYDALDRKIGLYKGTSVSSSGQLAQWDYDQALFDGTTTRVLGRPSQSSRIDGTKRYITAVNKYDQHYQPTESMVTIPSGENGLGGDYKFSTGYNADGSVRAAGYPTSGDLQLETAFYGYNGDDQPSTLLNSYGTQTGSSIVSDSKYDALGHATQYTLYTGFYSGTGSRAYLNFETDQTTGRMNEISVHRDGISPNTVTDLHYTYDDAGNVTKMADDAAADTQCFTYDRYQRLTEAWTPSSGNCATARSTAGLGGAAPYWQSYTYSLGGARASLTDHGTANGDVTTSYTYTDSTPTDPTTGQPHGLDGTTTTDNTGTRSAAYTYDKAGNTKTRPGPNGTQTLVWDAEGNLQSVTDTAGSTSYLYDADGNRLISRDTGGKTLYLPNEEVRFTNSTGATSCTRYYSFGGGTVAQRTSSGLTWLASDHQGTQNVSVDEQTQTSTIRRQTPFGTARGTSTPWVNTKGFVGGTSDPTGLTHLGAREYDPALGRFISVDPVLDSGDPQSMEGYAYSDNSPVMKSDPSGEMFATPDGGGSQQSVNEAYQLLKNGSNNDDDQPSSKPTPKKKKKCGWTCKAGGWIDDHKAVIAGAAAGIVVGLGCEAAIGWTGVGAVACGAAAGAVGSMVQYAVETKVEHKGNFSLGGMLVQGAIGGVVGGFTGGLGSIGNAGLRAGFSNLASGAGGRAAFNAGAAAMKKEASNIASGLTRGAFTRGAAESAEGAALPKPSCHSFAPTTAVVMSDGTAKQIGAVQVGDHVLAGDPETGDKSERVVDEVHVNHDTALTDVTVKADGQATVVHTTQYHPFWDETQQRWVNAGDLTEGDSLRSTDGTSITVLSVNNFTDAQTMYDLTIKDVHTYYVLAGTTPVLVHNCGGGFKNGVAPDEIDAINRSFGGERELNGSAANALANASRYGSFWEKSGVMIRDIAGSHMYNNGNKRTAHAVVSELMRRNNVISGPTSDDLWSVIARVSDSTKKGHTMDVGEIAGMLRGY
ncbi:hypothetical protein GCM10010172_24000 [Paractinoplanes ferrugineus]|uniref:Type IV secretion protein Rhs n=1 Tax=Paractinoplanes ferrugineus TaxID=113564 RepID=A0A919MBR0_9ACTN|nr:polymorphic toxin-type HINT domain-containing protein [Actinoplanes ferrugineus]GIE08689.1 type IV secretion protein Rhs [Actinoplanes ferrugineus]